MCQFDIDTLIDKSNLQKWEIAMERRQPHRTKPWSALIARARDAGAPPLLASAMRYAVFPGGPRIRPQLCLAVAPACGDGPSGGGRRRRRRDRTSALRLAGARRSALFRRRRHPAGQAFGSRAVWRAARGADGRRADRAGLPDAGARAAHRPRGSRCSSRSSPQRSARPAASSPARPGNAKPPSARRLSARQDRRAVRRARPSRARRRPAPMPEPWRTLGEKLGEAYQVADDLRDVLCDADELGKPIGQDAARDRPNAAAAARDRRRARRGSRNWSAAAIGLDPAVARGAR